jgi:ABC transport system ATP-binding/permease protein
MLKLDADEKKLHEQLAAAATDYARAAELDAQLRAVQAEKEQVEEEWLAAAELAEG